MPGLLARSPLRNSASVLARYSWLWPDRRGTVPVPWYWSRWHPEQPTELFAVLAAPTSASLAEGWFRFGHGLAAK